MRGDFVTVQRKTRIFYNQRFFDYPLKPINALTNLGIKDSLLVLLSYIRAKWGKRKTLLSFEDWVSRHFGRKLYEIFFKVYTEKVWGISCDQIDADWASQRIQGLTLSKALRNAILPSGNKPKTLVDSFLYPISGNQLFYNRQAEFLRQNGVEIITSKRVSSIRLEGNQVLGVVTENGEEINARHVISTMPLTNLILGIQSTPETVTQAARQLRFRNTILVYLNVEGDNLFPDQWLYIHDPSVKHGRITNFNNWSPDTRPKDGSSILCLEFWCFSEDEFWNYNDEDLIDLATKELRAINLVPILKVKSGHVTRLPKSYPVYEKGYKEKLNVVTSWLSNIDGLTPIGRYGSFKYNNQDHSILMGLEVANQLDSGTKPDVWDINTDSEYQESGDAYPA